MSVIIIIIINNFSVIATDDFDIVTLHDNYFQYFEKYYFLCYVILDIF